MSREELFEELRKLLEEELKAYLQPLKNKAKETLNEHISADTQAKATAHAKEWHENVVDYVEEHPLQSVGIALAAGFLLARLFYKGKNP